MSEETHRRVDKLEKWVGTIQGEVNSVAVEMAKVNVTLQHMASSAKENESCQKIQHEELKDLLTAQLNQNHEVQITRQKWLQGLISPQTVIIILAIVAGFMGVRLSDLPAVTPEVIVSE